MKHFHKVLSFYILNTSVVFAGVFPLFNPLQEEYYSHDFFFQTQTFLANDPFTLRDLLLNDLGGKNYSHTGDNLAIGIQRADIGYSGGSFGYIGLSYREEVFMEATQDAVDVLYLTNNKKELEVSKNYDFYLLLKGYAMEGIVYAKRWNILKRKQSRIQIGGSCELLYATQMQDGYVDGYVEATSPKSYQFSGISSYNYTHNYLYDLSVNDTHAYGYTFHLSLQAETEKFIFSFIGNDIYGHLFWKNLPYSAISFSSDNKEYDADGYVKYKPLLSGKEGNKEYTQKLMAKYSYKATYKYDKKIMSYIGLDIMQGYYFPYVGLQYLKNKQIYYSFEYDTYFHSLFLSLHYRDIAIGVRADDIFSPKNLGVNFSISF